MPGFPLPDPNEGRLPLPALPVTVHTARFPTAYRGQPPGAVSAVGGIGIAVGVLGILASLALFSVAGGLMSVSAASAQRVRQFAPNALPISKPDHPATISISLAPQTPGANGMAETQRQWVMFQVQQVLPLSDGQQKQLDALLCETGTLVFPGPAPIADALTDRGTMPTATTTSSPPTFFVTTGGRVQIYDDGAVFYPAKGSATVRTTAGPAINRDHPVLRPGDIEALLELIRQTSGGAMNAAQREALGVILASPEQKMIALDGPPGEQTIGITGAGPQRGGYLLVGFAGGSLLLSPTGKPLLAGDPLPGVSIVSCIGVMLMALLGVGMAIWLLVLSRRLTKQTLITPRLHRRYVMMKIVASIFAGAFFGWMIDSFLGSQPDGQSLTYRGILAGIALAAAGCVFPALVWVMFRKRNAKLYFDGVM